MAALEEIDEACLVTTLEVPALHQAKQIMQTLLDSGFGKNRIRLILNRAPKRLDITAGELEKMLGRADLLHDPERLSGAVRDVRRRPDAEPQLGSGQADCQAGPEAGQPRRRREERRRSASGCSMVRRNGTAMPTLHGFAARDRAITGKPAG